MKLQTPGPICQFCQDAGILRNAMYVAAQSIDGGRSISWCFTCDDHTQGWNDGGDWSAPIYRLELETSHVVI